MKEQLWEKLLPLLNPYKITEEAIVYAFEKSLEEIKRDGSSSQHWLLSLVFWKIFEYEYLLVIPSRTTAGNTISLEVLTVAHAMWQEAQRAAVKRGLDDMAASDAMIYVVCAVADRLAHEKDALIDDLEKYIFAGYMRRLKRIAEKAGIVHPKKLKVKRAVSDDGAFQVILENAILCGQLLGNLTETEENAAIMRYLMGYSCKETAKILGLSNNAARKALCTGLQKSFGANLRELRESGYMKMKKRR